MMAPGTYSVYNFNHGGALCTTSIIQDSAQWLLRVNLKIKIVHKGFQSTQMLQKDKGNTSVVYIVAQANPQHFNQLLISNYHPSTYPCLPDLDLDSLNVYFSTLMAILSFTHFTILQFWGPKLSNKIIVIVISYELQTVFTENYEFLHVIGSILQVCIPLIVLTGLMQ